MGWFHNDSAPAQAFEAYGSTHKADLTHELLAGAAAFEAAKAYEKHVAANGKPESHERAKELFAGFAGAFIDREVETKGLDFIDKERVKHQAQSHIGEVVNQDNY